MTTADPRRIVLEQSPGQNWIATLYGSDFTVRDKRHCLIAIEFAMRKAKWERRLAEAKVVLVAPPVVVPATSPPAKVETTKAPEAPAPKPWVLVIPKEKPSAK